MIQSIQLQKARIPALALGALALAAVGATVLPRLSVSASPQPIVTEARSTTFEQRPLVVPAQADNTACGAGAYVSGDIAGETSPAEIYAAMCGRSR